MKLHSRATVSLSCEKDPQVQICPKIFVHDCRMDHIISVPSSRKICPCLFCLCMSNLSLPILRSRNIKRRRLTTNSSILARELETNKQTDAST